MSRLQEIIADALRSLHTQREEDFHNLRKELEETKTAVRHLTESVERLTDVLMPQDGLGIVAQLALIKSTQEVQSKTLTNCVTSEEFKPVKLIVYGMVGAILTTVLGALLVLVVNNKAHSTLPTETYHVQE
jgi:hypothetical protein